MPCSLHWIPKGAGTVWHTVTGTPPVTGMRLRPGSVQNTIDWPSGENAG